MKIWSGQLLNEGNPLYNMILTYKIGGTIDVDRFSHAFQKLVDNNDVLRLKLEVDEGVPQQVFEREAKSNLEFYDFSNKDNPSLEYTNWLKDNKGRIFGSDEFLYHAALFKIKDDQFVFYLNQYHLITDGWSMKYVYDELNKFYSASEEQGINEGYTEFSYESYANKNPFAYTETHSTYWKEKLGNINTPPALYGRNLLKTKSNSTRVTLHLGKERSESLKALTDEKDIKAWTRDLSMSTIFNTIVAALIYKIGGQNQFTFGVPFHNRTSAEEKNIAGLFMELLPLDVSVKEDDTLASLFKKLTNESFEVIKNATVSNPPVELLRSFNVLLNFIPMTLSKFSGMPMECDWVLADHIDSSHHLRLQIQDFNNTGDYQLQFDLNNDVFPNLQKSYVADHFLRIVDAFISNRHQRISDINLITDAEVEKIKDWNNTGVEYEENESLLTRFERQVATTPNAPALIFEGTQLDYIALDQRSNQVANYLIQKGVSNNDIIAISLTRSLEMMIYIYGIIKAGAAYLPLDIEIPNQRLKFILEDAGAKFLFYNHLNIDANALPINISHDINTINPEVASMSSLKPEINIPSDNLAYVIYTSGSTGEPKGVLCHHSGICNRLNWMRTDFSFTKEDTFIQKTPLTFDVSVPELFFALQIGSKLVIEFPGGHKDPQKLIKSVLDNKITVIHFVPAMLNAFLISEDVEKCESLKIIFCSGEALSVETVKKVYSRLKDVQVHNLYGPTEASVEVSKWFCHKDSLEDGLPIGHPVANTQLYILDKSMRQVPIGVVGELYIAGKQVTHGYLNRESLNADRFVANTIDKRSTHKMYRTGDLTRYRQDGAIEYLGRTDTQVKLRGFRIELGEIEKVIEKHHSITQVIVILEKSANKEDYLMAYYSGEEVPEDEIKSLLGRSIPDYMIPSIFLYVDEFILLSSGKIDRKKLPKIDLLQHNRKEDYQEPSSAIEEAIEAVWKDVLKLDRISTKENFIYLGGNSLSAIMVTLRLKKALDLDTLSITDVFFYPTIELYGEYVEKTIIELLGE